MVSKDIVDRMGFEIVGEEPATLQGFDQRKPENLIQKIGQGCHRRTGQKTYYQGVQGNRFFA